jgi:uncharacterized protein (TIGR02246 family)
MTYLALRYRNCLTVSCTLLLVACSKAPPTAPVVPPLSAAQVQDFVREYVAATNAGDATKITSMIARDPDVTSVAYGEVLRGWDAIRKEVDDHIASAPGSKVTFATVSVQQLGADVAVASAPFTFTLGVDGKTVQLAGAASMVVRRSEGQLLVVHEHYSLKTE